MGAIIQFPPGSLIVGIPAKPVKEVTDEQTHRP
jgi:hypothetical protein